MANPVEVWKSEKHGFDVWDNLLQYAAEARPMKDIDTPELERMKWHGVFYRKRDTPGSYMLRIRLTGCELSAAAAKEIAYVAYEYGYGIVDITTRANIQLQGLHVEHVPRALERLEAVGLTAKQTGHDNIRNVFCHSLSGVDPPQARWRRSGRVGWSGIAQRGQSIPGGLAPVGDSYGGSATSVKWALSTWPRLPNASLRKAYTAIPRMATMKA